MKRKDGFIILDEQQEITRPQDQERDYGSNEHLWFSINGEEYFYKQYQDLSACYTELFCEEIAKSLNIPTATYDLAIYKGQTGIISKNYNPTHKNEVHILTLIKEIYKNKDMAHNMPKKVSNLETIWNVLEYHYFDNPHRHEIVENIMKGVVDSFILQLCTGNTDLHVRNLVIIEDENPHLAPNFDYGFGLSAFTRKSKFHPYSLNIDPYSDLLKVKELMEQFFSTLDAETVEYCYQKIIAMPTSDEVFEKIEEKIGMPVDEFYKYLIEYEYEIYQPALLSVIKDFHQTQKRK